MPVDKTVKTISLLLVMALVLGPLGGVSVKESYNGVLNPSTPDSGDITDAPDILNKDIAGKNLPNTQASSKRTNFGDLTEMNGVYSTSGIKPSQAAWGNWSYRDAHNVPMVANMGYEGAGVSVALVDTGIDFGNINLADKYMTVDDPTSPYYGWPMAFDPLALSSYLQAKEVRVGNGWYANTSINGTGPFDVNHEIKVDGKNDFSQTELVGKDRYSDVRVNGTSTKAEFDLNELFITRDDTYWYGGVNTRYAEMNRTFGFALDFDGAASGGLTDPRGNYLHFKASHSAPVEQVAYSPDNNLIASCAASGTTDAPTSSYSVNSVKIWGVDGSLIETLPSEVSNVFTIAWSSDGSYLAYQTLKEVIVYETSGWTEVWRVETISESDGYRESMTFSPDNSILYFGMKLPRLGFLFMNNGTHMAKSIGGKAFSLAFNPISGDKIAVGLGDGYAKILDSTFPYSEILQFKDPILSSNIETVAWSPDETKIITGIGSLGTSIMQIWDASTGAWIANITGGHDPDSTVNTIKWLSTGEIITGADDGNMIVWDDTTYSIIDTKVSINNEPIYSFDINDVTGEYFLGTADCLVTKFSSDWGTTTPFAAQRPDVMIYIDYEREYYTFGADGQKLTTRDQIFNPDVYKWDESSSSWESTNLSAIGGEYIYKGSLAGEFTEVGFVEWSIPRNYSDWPGSNDLYVSSFICDWEPSRPQDTIPMDCNVPSPPTSVWVDFTNTEPVGISAWGHSYIPKTTVDHAKVTSVSPDDTYHFGYHPSKSLTKMLGPVSILVVESTTLGEWDQVYIDMNTDYIIDDNDIVVDINNPLAVWDAWNGSQPGSDGYPDISGGLLYFIANGTNKLPYSDRMGELLELTWNEDSPMPIPGNGELVAFYGEFDYDDLNGEIVTHGTQMASVIASEGVINGQNGPIEGVSPDIKFLPMCNAQYDLENSLYFAVEGYDGIPNTGDEANIVSTGQYSSGYDNGLDSTSSVIESLVNYTNSNVTFIAPSGNDGSGYGTIASPCGPSTLVVGFAEDNTFVSGGGDVHHYGSVGEASSRGPTATGLIKPDIIALGSGETDMPIGFSGSFIGTDGSKEFWTWTSSSEFATATATGVMALIYQAYEDTYGNYPTIETAMSLIKSSGRDLGHDPYTQGSGFIDAYTAILAATGATGLTMDVPDSTFGDSYGSSYTGFIDVMDRGDSAELSIDIENLGSGTEDVVYSMEYLRRIDVSEFNITMATGTSEFEGELSSYIPLEAQVIKVVAQTPYVGFSIGYGDYSITLWDWEDAQGPGETNYGIIDDSDDISYLISTHQESVNSLVCTYALPYGGLAGKLIMDIIPSNDVGALLDRNWTITVESFALGEWDWLEMSKSTDAIPTGGTSTLDLTMTIPDNALPGTYGASIVASYDEIAGSFNDVYGPTLEGDTSYLDVDLDTTHWDDGAIGNYWDDYGGAGTYALPDGDNADRFPQMTPFRSTYTAHNPIAINGNGGFSSVANSGAGTAMNPWVIEGYEIDGTAFSQAGISIENTDAYFIVRNCYIHDAQGSAGVYLDNVENGAFISNNVSANAQQGFYVTNSDNLYIADNDIMDNLADGIDLSVSEYVTIAYNDIFNNAGNGFASIAINMNDDNYCNIIGNYMVGRPLDAGFGCTLGLYTSHYNVISGNNMTDEDQLIDAWSATNNEVTYNTFVRANEFTAVAFWTAASNNNDIHHNAFYDIDISGWPNAEAYDDDASNNWDDGAEGNFWDIYTGPDADVNGIVDAPFAIGGGVNQDNFPLVTPNTDMQGYLPAHAPIVIDGDADFTAPNGVVSGTGTSADPYIIEGWSIVGPGNAIQIMNTTEYYVIKNCQLIGNGTDFGIFITNSTNGVVRFNDISGFNAGIGIGSTDISVSHNMLYSNIVGVTLGMSTDVTLEHNVVDAGMFGFYVSMSEDCYIMNNDISGSAVYGIQLNSSSGINYVYYNNLMSNTGQAFDDTLGDTVDDFELFAAHGVPADLIDVYDVAWCNISVDGVPLVVDIDYTLDIDTGYIMFTPTLNGLPGGSNVLIDANLIYTESIPTGFSLDDKRLVDASAVVDIYHKRLNGTMEQIADSQINVNYAVGTVALNYSANLELGLYIFANYTYYNRTVMQSFSVNVQPQITDTGSFTYGDSNSTEEPGVMPTWGMRPGQGSTLQSGDRRYFHLYVPAQGLYATSQLDDYYLFNELSWGMNATDLNFVIYGKGDAGIMPSAAPYYASSLGASEEKADFSFFTATEGPKEVLVTPFANEIITIVVSAKSFNGTGDSVEMLEGSSGWLKLSSKNPKTWTDNQVGHMNVSMFSNLNLDSGIYASIVGPAQGQRTTEDVYVDDLSNDDGTMEGWLTLLTSGAYTKVVTVENALSWDVHIWGDPTCPDLDLAVFLDGLNGQPKDGEAQWQEIITKNDIEFDAYASLYGTGSYAYCADMDADEALKFISPPDGDYIIKVLGYTVMGNPSHFDLELKTIFSGVEGYKIMPNEAEFADEDTTSNGYLNETSIPSFTERSFSVLWNFPEGTVDNVYGGIYVLGIPEANKLIVISTDISLDREAPTIIPQYTGPGTITSSRTPLISANIIDTEVGEIDPIGVTVLFDGVDVTTTSLVLVSETESSGALGYWNGAVSYTPANPLSDGGHMISIASKDFTGNEAVMEWAFTVDTLAPALSLNSANYLHVTDDTYTITGTSEPDANVKIMMGAESYDVEIKADGSFSQMISLDVNRGTEVVIEARDMADNIARENLLIVYDTDLSAVSSLQSSNGYITNKDYTILTGSVDEPGELKINGMTVEINSVGTFSDVIDLVEGSNVIEISMTDLAGNVLVDWVNVTKDTVAPIIDIEIPDMVTDGIINISGKVLAGYSVKVNGKIPSTDSTRDGDIDFTKSLVLSYGLNTIVIEAKDDAGNVMEFRHTIDYTSEDAGTNYAAIGMMIVLLVVGLVVGLLVAMAIWKERPYDEDVPSDDEPEELVEDEEVVEEEIMDEEAYGEEPMEVEEDIYEGDVEPIETEEEIMDISEDPVDIAEEPADIEVEEEIMDIPDDAEPIPMEEGLPEEMAEEEPIADDTSMVEESLEEAPPEEDERVIRLTKAFEDGKISEELYNKNLAKLKDE